MFQQNVYINRRTELKQLLKSGTSIGANIAEAVCGISEKDFLAKLYIAFKECAETEYWLELLKETGFLTNQEYTSISADCLEIKKLLSSITKTTKDKTEESGGGIIPNS